MIIFNIEKVSREELKVLHRGKMYDVVEPTVSTWAEIKRDLDRELQKGEVEGYKFLIGKMIPTMLEKPMEKKRTWKDVVLRRKVETDTSTVLDKALKSEIKMIAEICLKVLSGRGAEGKMKAPEDIMERR